MPKKAKAGRPKGALGKSTRPIEFFENAIYTAEQAGKILQRHPATVRRLCELGRLPHNKDSKGYFISGYVLRSYAENRLNTASQ